MCLASQVLALAAQELSRPVTQNKAPAAISASDDLSPHGSGDDKPLDWRQEVERRIQTKTRRITKVETSFRHMDFFFFLLLLVAPWPFDQPAANFWRAAGRHQSFTRGHAEPLRQPSWTLLLSFAQELRHVSLFSTHSKDKHRTFLR